MLVQAGVTVTMTSESPGAPKGCQTLSFSVGEKVVIKEVRQEDGKWYATERRYGSPPNPLWFPLSSTDWAGAGSSESTASASNSAPNLSASSCCVVTKANFAAGREVVRGPDWKWGGQDGGEGSVGLLAEAVDGDCWVGVSWASSSNKYRLPQDKSREKRRDLCYVASNCVCRDAPVAPVAPVAREGSAHSSSTEVISSSSGEEEAIEDAHCSDPSEASQDDAGSHEAEEDDEENEDQDDEDHESDSEEDEDEDDDEDEDEEDDDDEDEEDDGDEDEELHPSHTCDGCETSPIRGPRWRCGSCDDFDYCDLCYANSGNGSHDQTHEFTQQIGKFTRVQLAEGYESVTDAAGGPLKPGDQGVVIRSERACRVRAPNGQEWWYQREALKPFCVKKDKTVAPPDTPPSSKPRTAGGMLHRGMIGNIAEYGRVLSEQDPVFEIGLKVPLDGSGQETDFEIDRMAEDNPRKQICVSLVESGCAFPRCIATVRDDGEVMINNTAPLTVGEKVRIRRCAALPQSDALKQQTVVGKGCKHVNHSSKCMVCTHCFECTGFGAGCCNHEPGREGGSECGCGGGKSGCKICGLCKKCQDKGVSGPLASTVSSVLAVGAKVRVKKSISSPRYGWGSGVTHASVGTLESIDDDDDVLIAFPGRSSKWRGKKNEIECVRDAGSAVMGVGSAVRLSQNYADFSDASGGPLQPGDIGTIRKDDKSSKPFHVETSDGSTWWYKKEALELVHEETVAPSAPITHDSVGTIRSITASGSPGGGGPTARVSFGPGIRQDVRLCDLVRACISKRHKTYIESPGHTMGFGISRAWNGQNLQLSVLMNGKVVDRFLYSPDSNPERSKHTMQSHCDKLFERYSRPTPTVEPVLACVMSSCLLVAAVALEL